MRVRHAPVVTPIADMTSISYPTKSSQCMHRRVANVAIPNVAIPSRNHLFHKRRNSPCRIRSGDPRGFKSIASPLLLINPICPHVGHPPDRRRFEFEILELSRLKYSNIAPAHPKSSHHVAQSRIISESFTPALMLASHHGIFVIPGHQTLQKQPSLNFYSLYT